MSWEHRCLGKNARAFETRVPVRSQWLTGVAILVLTVPIYFPVALSLGVDPVHLGILTALCIEIGSVIPPVGLNLFAVSGVT